MVLDAKNMAFAIANGILPEDIHGETHFNADGVCKGITFRNFSNLCLDEATFLDCQFENCHSVSISGCEMRNCTFVNVNDILGHYSEFVGSKFIACCSNGPLLTIDSKGTVDGCTFESVTAKNEDGYIVWSVFARKEDASDITNSRFVNCRVENEEKDLCRCTYYRGFPVFTDVSYANIDYNSCEIKEVGANETVDRL